MRIAHLILAHDYPNQLKRLVTSLTHRDADIYIHIDFKTYIEPFEELKKLPNVFFITRRIKVYWGSYNIVEATINGFKQIADSGIDYGYINLLSGQDYPLGPSDDFLYFLSANPGKAFMNSLVAETDWKEALPRVQEYHLTNFTFPGKYMLQKVINTLSPRRKMPNDLILVGRSQWFTISADCMKHILDYWDRHSALKRFVKFTWAPDEFIFQTILYNSHLKDTMVNNNLRYIDWSAGGAHPKILTVADTEALINSGKFFARKFEEKKDSAILDHIDRHIEVITWDRLELNLQGLILVPSSRR